MGCALALGAACSGKLALVNARGDAAGTASGGIAGATSSVGVIGSGGRSGSILTGGTTGLAPFTGGNNGLGGSSPNLGTTATCTVDLARIRCPATYGEARSPAICYAANPDHPRIATCADLIIFEFGHDGSSTCIYDASTNNLLGGSEWGGGTGISPSICPTIYSGLALPDSCTSLTFTACTVDAG
jgi:hypothetical protein